jgi:EAL domain-containing protein (putative c-di-GMP-specific phosphodiesterase class I)
MAHNMQLDVIAEGVEKLENLHTLESLNCEFAQGYFFSHPLNRDDAELFMVKQHTRDNAVEHPTGNVTKR